MAPKKKKAQPKGSKVAQAVAQASHMDHKHSESKRPEAKRKEKQVKSRVRQLTTKEQEKAFGKTTREYTTATTKWLDWYGTQKGFKIHAYRPTIDPVTPTQLFEMMTSNEALCFLKDGLYTPTRPWLKHLLLEASAQGEKPKWRYPGTEIILALAANGTERKIIGVLILINFTMELYQAGDEGEVDEKGQVIRKSDVEYPVFRLAEHKRRLNSEQWMDIHTVCVDPAWRKKGVGRALLVAAVAKANSKSISVPLPLPPTTESKESKGKGKGKRKNPNGRKRVQRLPVTGLFSSVSQWWDQASQQKVTSDSAKLFHNAGFDRVHAFDPKTNESWRANADVEESLAVQKGDENFAFEGHYFLLTKPKGHSNFWTRKDLEGLFGKPNAFHCGKGKNWFGLPTPKNAIEEASCRSGMNWLHYLPTAAPTPSSSKKSHGRKVSKYKQPKRLRDEPTVYDDHEEGDSDDDSLVTDSDETDTDDESDD